MELDLCFLEMLCKLSAESSVGTSRRVSGGALGNSWALGPLVLAAGCAVSGRSFALWESWFLFSCCSVRPAIVLVGGGAWRESGTVCTWCAVGVGDEGM